MNLCRGIERVDEGTSNNPFQENEMLDMLNDLQISIEHEEVTEEDLENEMPFSGVEQETKIIFQDLMNEARNKLYPGCLEISSLNFLVKLMHIKVLNSWSNKSFDMLLKLLKVAFPTGKIIPTSFYIYPVGILSKRFNEIIFYLMSYLILK